MSVLNTMLRDLERRGARPVQALPSLQPAWAEGPAPAPAPRWRLRLLSALLLAAAASAAALWLWHQPAPSPARSAIAPIAPIAPLTHASATGVGGEGAVPAPGSVAPVAATTTPEPAEPMPALPMHPHSTTPSRAAVPTKAPKPKSDPGQTHGSEAPARSAAVSPSAAQSDLTRATELIARGRSTEAAQLLASALATRPGWHEARSTLAALQAEHGDRRQALATLLDGATIAPGRFALTAAQLQAELNDPVGALKTLEQVPAPARDDAFLALLAAIAQRAGQHELAVTEYRALLRSAPAHGLAWVGLGVSLQALGREAQALAAYRGAAQASLSADLRGFVESRITALQSTAPPDGAAAPVPSAGTTSP